MRIVVDTNIVFSAILNTNSKIGKILLHPKSKFNFYSTNTLKYEIEEHKSKLKRISGLTDSEFELIYGLIISRIRFINVEVIPVKIFKDSLQLCKDIDIDDTEFVALTDHAKAKLWTGDKVLSKGLIRMGWRKIITTSDLYEVIRVKKKK